MVEDYKYSGVTINHRLDWTSSNEAVYKKGMSRLRKLRSFNVCSKMLEIFSLWWPVYCSLLWFVWGAASEPATSTDSTNSSGRLALWLAANMTLRKLWWRGGHWKNCYPSWIIFSTLSNSHWSDSRAPSPEGCFSFVVIITDTGNLSLHNTSAWKRELWLRYCFVVYIIIVYSKLCTVTLCMCVYIYI